MAPGCIAIVPCGLYEHYSNFGKQSQDCQGLYRDQACIVGEASLVREPFAEVYSELASRKRLQTYVFAYI